MTSNSCPSARARKRPIFYAKLRQLGEHYDIQLQQPASLLFSQFGLAGCPPPSQIGKKGSYHFRHLTQGGARLSLALGYYHVVPNGTSVWLALLAPWPAGGIPACAPFGQVHQAAKLF